MHFGIQTPKKQTKHVYLLRSRLVFGVTFECDLQAEFVIWHFYIRQRLFKVSGETNNSAIKKLTVRAACRGWWQINLEPTVFKVTGKVWWDSTIHPLYVQRKPADGDDQLLICASVPPAMLMTFLQCPRCSKVESIFCTSFLREDLDTLSKCH